MRLEYAPGCKAFIDALETDRLEDIRKKIQEEWDEGMIPSPFRFHFDEFRFALKQEKKIRAWDLLSNNVRLQKVFESGDLITAECFH